MRAHTLFFFSFFFSPNRAKHAALCSFQRIQYSVDGRENPMDIENNCGGKHYIDVRMVLMFDMWTHNKNTLLTNVLGIHLSASLHITLTHSQPSMVYAQSK